MINFFKINSFLILFVLVFCLVSGCSKKSFQGNSNLHNFENQDFMAGRTLITEEPAVSANVSDSDNNKGYYLGRTEMNPVSLKTTTDKVIKKSQSDIVASKVTSKSEVKKEVKKKVKELKKVAEKESRTEGGKSQLVAILICWIIGTLGIHRFYLGYTTIGIIQLLTLGGCGIWTLIDLIRIIIGDLKPKDGEYEKTI